MILDGILARVASAALLAAALHGESPESPAFAVLGRVTGQLTLLERSGVARNDLATAVIYLQSLDGRDDGDHLAVPVDATIAMRGREFIPRLAIVRRGGRVKFPNQDPFSHNVFSNTDPVSFDLGLYRRGATREAIFGEHGVYPIYCNIHAKMVSYVVSVPSGHVTRADDAGQFTFTDVPLGAYRLTVWHERAAKVTQDISITASGTSVRLTLDARGYVPGAHLNKFGMPYTTTRSDRY